MVNHHMETSLDELKAALDPVPSSFKDLRDSERIAQAIRMRLTMNAKFIETNRWHEAMATGALPSNVLKTAQYLNDTLDVILGTAKTAEVTTLGKYGARAAVGGVYLSTELFMLTDESEGFRYGQERRAAEERRTAGERPRRRNADEQPASDKRGKATAESPLFEAASFLCSHRVCGRDTWEYLGRRMNEIERAGEGLGRGELADVAVASGAAAAAIGGAVVSLAGPTAVRAFGEIGMGLSKFGLSSVLGGLGGAAKNEARTEDSFYESNNADDGGWVLDTEDEGKEKLNADALFPK